MNKNYYAILMAGGVGSRFWPVSTAGYPKQFQDILGSGSTLLQTTFFRLAKMIPKENIYILTHKNYTEIVKKQLPKIDEEQIVAEPAMRNTAPSILLGALKIKEKNKDALMVVAPSDHWIQEEDKFSENLQQAFDEVEKEDKLLTLGIEPTFPNTGYGYIKYDKGSEGKVKPVIKFTEKPKFEKAKEFIEEGNYVWNAGIFVWSARFIIESFDQYLPEMLRLFNKGEDFWNKDGEKEFLEENYGLADNISIDYGIMENSDSVYVIPADFNWNDLGTWGSLQDELPQDEGQNTMINCKLLPIESSGNIVRTEGSKIVVLEGLKDYIVVESEKVLLVVPKSKEQDIKKIREKVMEDFGEYLG
ncbi:mannose-1-phosphate guanylyltransferase [Salegentibacter chungangensis]|uniref:Mannose-1-phosphate guanylyltransferase n=1 Tax=Salegentibacter chungangensis TaxID=1335724 RepID=A0ABW3NV13_9FLAO